MSETFIPVTIFGLVGRLSAYLSANISWVQGASTAIAAQITDWSVHHGFRSPIKSSNQHLMLQALYTKVSAIQRRYATRITILEWKESSRRSRSMVQYVPRKESILEIPAIISDCKKYRYLLTRQIPGSGRNGPICFIGKNPSTADGIADDATIRRCVKIATKNNHSHLAVVNLWPWRETHPEKLFNIEDPVGPDCDYYILKAIEECQRIVLMWGAPRGPKKHKDRELSRQQHVLSLLQNRYLECVGKTVAGFPRHVLYNNCLIEPFE